MFVLLDNFDSFTYNLLAQIQQTGAICRVVRNDRPLAEVLTGEEKGLILSPGPGQPQEAGNLLAALALAEDRRLPVLGICLGHQAIGIHCGANLQRAGQPRHGKLSAITVQPDALFANLPCSLNVVRYHSLLLTDLPACLVPLAHTTEGELMALRHRQLPWWGVQFHPEAVLTEGGQLLVSNWLRLAAGLGRAG